VIHFIGASAVRHPWTIELISAGLAIGNVAYMYYKATFRRVRPSILCPGLIPPFGPPAHPAFPSGHSFLGHLIALLLLEIPAIARRHGVFDPLAPVGSPGVRPGGTNVLDGRGEIPSPLLWLAQRLAKNRERIGVHYPSDSSASRHLAAGIWWALLHDTTAAQIVCPTLHTIIRGASALWCGCRYRDPLTVMVSRRRSGRGCCRWAPGRRAALP
jgi:membrane-associated phospholipid phosphatase